MELDITKSEVYKTELHELTDWDEYLLKHCQVPLGNTHIYEQSNAFLTPFF